MSATTPSAVVCRGLVKEFTDGSQTLQVLRGIDTTFAAGQLSLLVGPSGCGKTTLISIIAGTLSATQGEVCVFGQELTRMKRAELVRFRRQTVGFIFQQYNLLPTLTAAENACVALAAAGMARRPALERASDMLHRLGLGDHLGKLPSQLSGGQQQRVAIARALVHGPRLVVCDEPTAALDAKTGHTVMELLREAAVAQDRACIVVTHDNRIFDLADRIVHMEDGHVIDPPAGSGIGSAQ
ncbi:MAG: ABC transporter ATP-binding protein [Serpentinimonas sp.]|jgi:putative ABC transport system ATP-binding protein|nr:ABC transporter ATP-binding protein [Serpentinimonas sp.]